MEVNVTTFFVVSLVSVALALASNLRWHYALPMTTETLPSIDYPHVGSHQIWTSPLGSCTITVRRGEFTFTVTTTQGPHRDSSRCAAYENESRARGYARMLAEMALAADTATTATTATTTATTVAKESTTMTIPPYARQERLTCTPVAKGSQNTMTFAQASKIYEVGGFGGCLHRGRSDNWARATTATLTAMAKRGYGHLDIAMVGKRKIVTGLTVSMLGALRASEVLSESGNVEAAKLVAESIPHP